MFFYSVLTRSARGIIFLVQRYIYMKDDKYNNEPIGDRIRRRREELRISQEELARRVGYSGKTSISKIEKSVNGIPQDKVTLFAKALQTTELYLLGMVDNPNMTTDEIITADHVMHLSRGDQLLLERFHSADEEKKRLIAYLLELDK